MDDVPTPTPNAIDLYWRPGCMFCRSLERGLKRTGIPVRRHNIWDDPEAAAVVRRATGGSETVPTVVVGDESLVNPSASAVQALVRQVAPELESVGVTPRRWFPFAAGRLTVGTAVNGPTTHPSGRLAAAVGLAAAVVAAGCSGSSEDVDATGAGSGSGGEVVEQVVGSPVEDVPSALDSMTASGLPDPLVEPSEVRSGGPPPDGIPPIDEPTFLDVDEVDFLEDREPVLAVEVDGEARAYPVQIMIWHEIVNDTIADEPVTITYCPLCNTAVGFDRTVGDRVLSFGTSGSLYQSSLVMYDRQTESLWTHVDGRAIAGVLTGTVLERIPVQTIAWRDWSDAHPDGLVLSRDTGASRDYGRNPYPGYDDVSEDPFLFDGELDDRLPAKQRVIATGDAVGDPVAVPLDLVLEAGVVETEVEGDPVVIWATPGTASALDAREVAEGRDVGATGVFRAELDGDAVEFRRDDDGFVDAGTGSRWNVLGTATAGPLAGRTLDRLEHVDTFWFAWAAFSPDTRLER